MVTLAKLSVNKRLEIKSSAKIRNSEDAILLCRTHNLQFVQRENVVTLPKLYEQIKVKRYNFESSAQM